MNIPLMLRFIAVENLKEAIKVVKEDIALPGVLGRICPAPCEKGCRRKKLDSSVSICLLKKYVADTDLASDRPYMPVCAEKIGKSAGIIGAGPAGLSAAYYLTRNGISCTIYDRKSEAGGMLRYGVEKSKLSDEILDREIATIFDLGIEFKGETDVGVNISFKEIRTMHDAVFAATGSEVGLSGLPGDLESKDDKLVVNNKTYETSCKGVFAGGDIVRKRRLAVRSIADGKEAALSILQYLNGVPVTGPGKRFNSKMGDLSEDGLHKLAEPVEKCGRIVPSNSEFTPEQARLESQRCLHCDCRKPEKCKLRLYSEEYGASSSAFKCEKPEFEMVYSHPDIVFEQGKCIRCGLCIQTAQLYNEDIGITFAERGFNVKIKPALDKGFAQALEKCAKQCAENCPTGAIAVKSQL
jgi:NADPH-dependent glutamate synthase beta subunit-like oxidoreductase/ferredoxin